MKKMMRLAAAALALVLLAGALSGCTKNEEKKLHAKAAEYVKALQNNKAVSDTFTLSDARVDFSDKTSSVPFAVSSKTYGNSFTVWVSRSEGNAATDDYYCLYLRREAEDKLQDLVTEVLGEGIIKVAVDFEKVENAALSGHAAGSLEELMQIAADKVGLENILIVDLVSAELINLGTEEVDRLLLALQEKGYYCTFYPYVSDAVWFEVRKDGFWMNKQTGADGGAYLQRDAYEPSAGK